MAYAAVFSLSDTITSPDIRKITQFEWDGEFSSLLSMLERLDDECYRGIDRNEIQELEAKITEAAWKLEDVIESYQLNSHGLDEERVEQEICSFFETAEKLRKQYEKVLQNSCVAVSAAEEDHVIHDVVANSATVGLSDLSQQIITGLLDDNSEVKIFTIWGMAGIGKTHRARDIYHHPLIVQHFDLRVWVSIGSKHRDIKNIYVDILAQLSGMPKDLFEEKDKHKLRDLLRSSLLGVGGRYLVAFDDVWSESVFNDCMDALLPYCKTLVTTRSCKTTGTWLCAYHNIHLLSDEESWNLLSKNVFGEKPFPTQLERAGRKIAEICEGLPLLILTVADILRGLDQTEECWNKVAEKRTTTFQDAYDRIYKVLVLSYDYLPQKYKACFLYMGVFRQSYKILVSKLLHLWFVENLYGNYVMLLDLALNSLVIFCKIGFHATVQSCKLHSVYWYVCVTEARKMKLFHVLNKLTDVIVEWPRRLSVQNNMLFGLKEVYDSMAATTSLTRSLLFTGEDHQYPVQVCFNTMLLMKVLDAAAIRFYEFLNEVLNLLQLSYLALTHYGEAPSSISKLQRLRILILRRHHSIIKWLQTDSTTCLPKEIWDLQSLLHFHIMGSNLPNPSHGAKIENLIGLHVNAGSCTESVFRGSPTLHNLRIEVELQPEGGAETLRCLEHTWILDELKSLKCVVVNPRLSSQVVDHLSKLPRSLTKLNMNGLGYPWKYISAIASLPNLVTLKLRCFSFRGAEWDIKDGEFSTLKYLLLEDIDVVHWTSAWNLPNLNHLVVQHCYKLKTIPFSCFPNMEMIEVDECSPSFVEIAQHIKVKRGVDIYYSWNL